MSDTPYAPNIRFPEVLQRNKGQVTTLKVYRDGAQIVPTACLYTLKKPGSGTVVENAAASISLSGTLTYTHSAGQLATTLSLGEGYIQEWSVTISGVVSTLRRMVSLVLQKLYPVISDIDLVAVYTNLNDLRASSLSSWQSYIDDAWYQLLRRIRNNGSGFEYLIVSPSALFDVHRHLVFYLIFRDFHSSLGQSNGRYLDLAQEHNREFHASFERVSWIYDQDHDAAISTEDANERTRGQPSIFLTRPGNWGRRFIR